MSTDIFVVNADGSGPQNLTRSNRLSDDDPALSRNGRRLVFERERSDGSGWMSLVTMRPRGGGARRVVELPEESAEGPSWSRDGQLIAFTALRPGMHPRVGVVRDDGSGLRWIPEAAYPAWLSHRRVAFVSSRGDQMTIAVARADGSRRRDIVVPDDLDPRARLQWPPEASPAGNAIAFSANSVVDNRRGLYVASVDGRFRPRRVSVGGSYPTWSPNGRRLAFYSAHALWTVDPDGRRRRVLWRSTTDVPNHPAWSRDGQKVAFVATNQAKGFCRVVVMDLRRRTFTKVARSARSGYGLCGGDRPVWSRDSRRLYYVDLPRS